MSRSAARLKVTSSPSSRIFPEVGSSSPAIIRSVVVLPQPEGPSMTKNSPSSTVKVESLHRDEIGELLSEMLDADLSHRAHSGKWLTMMNITVPTRIVTKD